MIETNVMNILLNWLGKMLQAVLLIIACSLCTSCGGSDVSTTISKPYKAIANLIPRRVPLAEVRPDDLRKLPTGADRALAWDRKLDAKRYAYGSWVVPKDYQAPTLPDSRTLPSAGGILPPLHPGQDSSLEGRGKLPSD